MHILQILRLPIEAYLVKNTTHLNLGLMYIENFPSLHKIAGPPHSALYVKTGHCCIFYKSTNCIENTITETFKPRSNTS